MLVTAQDTTMSGCRGPIDQQGEIPRVHVRCLDNAEPECLEYIEHGLEEEGVSWVIQSGFVDDEIAVAYEAALDSTLKIGVSVSESRIVIHHKQLPNEEPLFDVTDVTATDARSLGSNSARLAKGTPLKPVG